MRISLVLLCLLTVAVACSERPAPTVELKHFPLDALEGLKAQTGVFLDSEISADGTASIRIDTDQPVTIPLYEFEDVNVDDAVLMYQARVRTHNMHGEVYLEMWCGFNGKGEFFSRDLETPLTGTTNWSIESTPFYLQKGQKPDYIKLNLVVNGRGSAWIDDIRLFMKRQKTA